MFHIPFIILQLILIQQIYADTPNARDPNMDDLEQEYSLKDQQVDRTVHVQDMPEEETFLTEIGEVSNLAEVGQMSGKVSLPPALKTVPAKVSEMPKARASGLALCLSIRNAPIKLGDIGEIYQTRYMIGGRLGDEKSNFIKLLFNVPYGFYDLPGQITLNEDTYLNKDEIVDLFKQFLVPEKRKIYDLRAFVPSREMTAQISTNGIKLWGQNLTGKFSNETSLSIKLANNWFRGYIRYKLSTKIPMTEYVNEDTDLSSSPSRDNNQQFKAAGRLNLIKTGESYFCAGGWVTFQNKSGFSKQIEFPEFVQKEALVYLLLVSDEGFAWRMGIKYLPEEKQAYILGLQYRGKIGQLRFPSHFKFDGQMLDNVISYNLKAKVSFIDIRVKNTEIKTVWTLRLDPTLTLL